jgi:hypothetical protein
MSGWTLARVEERLRKALALRVTLSDRVNDFAPLAELPAADADGDDVVVKAVDALSWLRWLDPDDAQLVVARLEGAPWKLICWQFGISRPTADRRWRYALAVIAWHLNGHSASGRRPSLRSMLGLRRAARAECETSSGGTGRWSSGYPGSRQTR